MSVYSMCAMFTINLIMMIRTKHYKIVLFIISACLSWHNMMNMNPTPFICFIITKFTFIFFHNFFLFIFNKFVLIWQLIILQIFLIICLTFDTSTIILISRQGKSITCHKQINIRRYSYEYGKNCRNLGKKKI